MENSEIPQPSSENSEVRRDGGVLDKSQQAKPGSSRSKTSKEATKKNRKKETRKEVGPVGNLSNAYLMHLSTLSCQLRVH